MMNNPTGPRVCTLEFVADADDLVIVTASYRGMPDPQKPEEYEISRQDWARRQSGGHVSWLTEDDEITIMQEDFRPCVAPVSRKVTWMSTTEIVAEGQRCLERMRHLARGAQRNNEAVRIGGYVEMLNMPV